MFIEKCENKHVLDMGATEKHFNCATPVLIFLLYISEKLASDDFFFSFSVIYENVNYNKYKCIALKNKIKSSKNIYFKCKQENVYQRYLNFLLNDDALY